jgi:adenylate kinase
VGDSTRLVIVGKQGAGKGTQAGRLARRYGVPHIATGDMFRAAVRSGSDAGREAKRYLDAGDLVPDDVVIGVVEERLSRPDVARGFVLDGFPRTVPQAEALERVLEPDGVDLVIKLLVPTDVVLARLSKRLVCTECDTNYGPGRPPEDPSVCDACGGKLVPRDDDKAATIEHRLEVFEKQTRPLVNWYDERGCLVFVDGQASPDEVTERLVKAVEDRLGVRA